MIVTQDKDGQLESQTYTCYDKAGRTLRTIANWIDNGNDPDAWTGSAWTFIPEHNGTYNDENRIVENVYDGASRRTSVIDALGNSSTTVYNKSGQVLSVMDAEGAVTQYRYDDLKRRTRVVQNWIDNGEDPEDWVWDATDSRYEESDGTAIHANDTDPTNVIVMVDYDIAGRTVAMRDPRGNQTTYAYDKLGRRTGLTNPSSQTWATSYGDNTTSLLDPNGVTTQRDTDAMGRLIKIDYNNSANTPEVSFEYDVAGNRTKMIENDGTDDIRITHFGYDNARRLVSVGYDSDADDIIDESVTYEYDAGGLRTKMTLPGNLELNYGYNSRGQLVSISDWDGRLMRFTYDDAGRHAATLHPNGQRDKYAYNPAGHLQRIRHDRPNGSLMADFQYAVDKRGNRVTAQELMPIINGTGVTTIAHSHADVTYAPGSLWSDVTTYHETSKFSGKLSLPFYGQDLSLVVGTGSNHSMFDVYIGGSLFNTYDGYSSVAGERTINISLTYLSLSTLEIRNRPQHSLAAEHDANYLEDVYKFQFKELVVDGEYDLRTIQYTYDGLSRLLNADIYDGQNTNITPQKTYAYTWDRAGNRLSESIDANTVNYSYNNLNQIDDTGFVYDANGNMTSDGTNTYTWDRANRLKSVGGSTYKYDGLGNRISQTISSVVTDYLNDIQPGLTKVLRQSTGADDTYYLHTPRGVLYQQNPDNSWINLMHDGLNSTRAIVDENGNLLESIGYSPFGNPDVASVYTNVHFTGEFRDANDLQFHRARYYDPGLGVWVSLDPLETPNRYSYVSGNVVNMVDPLGLVKEPTGGLGGISDNYFEVTELCKSYVGNPNAYVSCRQSQGSPCPYGWATIEGPNPLCVSPQNDQLPASLAWQVVWHDITTSEANEIVDENLVTWQDVINSIINLYAEEIPESPCAKPWKGGLYVEGFTQFGGGILGATFGGETVYDFANMQRAYFSYYGLSAAWDVGYSLGLYAGIGGGFERNSIYGNISDQYEGKFVSSSLGGSSLGASLTANVFSSLPLAYPFIRGATVGISGGVSLQSLPFPKISASASGTNYYESSRNGTSKNYAKGPREAKYVNKEEVINDILNTDPEVHLPWGVRQFVSHDMRGFSTQFRQMIVPIAERWVDVYNARTDCNNTAASYPNDLLNQWTGGLC